MFYRGPLPNKYHDNSPRTKTHLLNISTPIATPSTSSSPLLPLPSHPLPASPPHRVVHPPHILPAAASAFYSESSFHNSKSSARRPRTRCCNLGCRRCRGNSTKPFLNWKGEVLFLSVSETCPNGFFLGGRCEVRGLAFGDADGENDI